MNKVGKKFIHQVETVIREFKDQDGIGLGHMFFLKQHLNEFSLDFLRQMFDIIKWEQIFMEVYYKKEKTKLKYFEQNHPQLKEFYRKWI